MNPSGALALALASLALASCGPDRSDPAAVLASYLGAIAHDDLDVAYALVSEDDRAFRTLDNYVALESTGDSVIVRELARRTRFEVLALEVEDERALARVHMRRPDATQALATVLQRSLSGEASFEDAAAEVLAGALPWIESSEEYVLVREPDGWRVRLGWRHEGEIASYAAAAELHASEGNIATALEVYRRALALDPMRIDVERRIAALASPPAQKSPAKAERRSAPPAAGETPYERMARNRALLRELAREELEDLGASPETLENAERAPYDEGRD
jgi:tetratricopeptide (TPR) repeat protein